MTRWPQHSDGRGSLRDIQILVNDHPSLFTEYIQDNLQIKSRKIKWVSPLKEDEYAEYRDNDFLKIIGTNSLTILLHDLWPKKGPQWDALGKGSDGEVFIVEAKANLPEMESPPSSAGEKSLKLIRESLNATKSYLGIDNNVDWSDKFYQYTNRLTHLFLLRVLNNIPAYLIFVYFVGDNSVSGPKTISGWNTPINEMKEYLGIGKHKLSQYVTDIFIDVNQLGL